MIVGVDEVGRGCWAGPVVAGAVVLDKPIRGLKDSKKLTRDQRVAFDIKIKAKAKAIGIGWVSSSELDEMGMTKAVRLAMDRAVSQVIMQCPLLADDQIIIDGNYNFLAHLPNTKTMIKADDKVPAVSAASIVAKVARDNWMATEAAKLFPLYGFESHVGYGTPRHRAAIEMHGLCDLHRRLFAPIRLKTKLDAEQLASGEQL